MMKEYNLTEDNLAWQQLGNALLCQHHQVVVLQDGDSMDMKLLDGWGSTSRDILLEVVSDSHQAKHTWGLDKYNKWCFS